VVGDEVGESVGLEEGDEVGELVGLEVRPKVGESDGLEVRPEVGESVGPVVGAEVGESDGLEVGPEVGEPVGLEVGLAVSSKGNVNLRVSWFPNCPPERISSPLYLTTKPPCPHEQQIPSPYWSLMKKVYSRPLQSPPTVWVKVPILE